MAHKSKRCTHYAVIAGGTNSADSDLVAQIVAALGRNVAVHMGHWMAHPSGVLARGTEDERGSMASPDDVLAMMQKRPQPKSSGKHSDFVVLATELVRAWRWDLQTAQSTASSAEDAVALLVQEFGAELAQQVALDWSYYAPASSERTYWHRVSGMIRNNREPKRAARKPTEKQMTEAQQHAAKMVKAWGREEALRFSMDWSVRADKRSERGHYERTAAIIQAMPA